MKLAELVQYINLVHKATFRLGERYSDGEQGAFALTDDSGRQYVLKWRPGVHNLNTVQRARAVTDVLRSINYPAPQYLFIRSAMGGIYSIQAALPGTPMIGMTTAFLNRLFELNSLQVNRALPGLQDWHRELVNTVLFGGERYCLHEPMLRYSQRTARLLRELQTLVTTYQHEPHRTSDIVHVDFQPANILVHEQTISGVVDWEGASAGDSAFDIATLLFYAYDVLEVRERLWFYLPGRVSLNLLSLYFSHLILRQVDWSLRHHDQATSERYISRGEALLQELAYYRRANRYT